MARNTDNIEGPSAIRARLASLQPQQLLPGTLTAWSDTKTNEKYWEFVGNGETTGTDLMSTLCERESGSEPGLTAHAANRDFARFAATQILGKDKQGYQPDEPIPSGQVEEVPLKDLLAAVTPFLESYAAATRASDAGGGQVNSNSLTGHNVFGQGLYIPLD